MKDGDERLVVALGAATSNGPCFAGVVINGPTRLKRGNRTGPSPLSVGFRPGRVPAPVLSSRYFGSAAILRTTVDRVDGGWVHGRGDSGHLPVLRASSVVVLGCGSVGAPVAVALAQAGIGRLALVDPGRLDWVNIGRHPLGAESVGLNKAEALARHLKGRFPHSAAEAHALTSDEFVLATPDLAREYTLIVSAIGNWPSESALNEWHIRTSRAIPIVYGWTEAHACAGHAVAINSIGGCFQCGLDCTGRPLLRLTEWPPAGLLRQEPACGAVYQPYGPVELSSVITLVTELVLDCLLGHANSSMHRIWAGRKRLLEEAGGNWTADWSLIAGEREEGSFMHERTWPASAVCRECSLAKSA